MTPDPGAPSSSSSSSSADALVGSLPVTVDPDAYAAAVAGVVFGMDTRRVGSEVYRDLLGEADPQLTVTGCQDLDRLVAERIPTASEWARMRANGQWSVFVVEEVWVPGSWTAPDPTTTGAFCCDFFTAAADHAARLCHPLETAQTAIVNQGYRVDD